MLTFFRLEILKKKKKKKKKINSIVCVGVNGIHQGSSAGFGGFGSSAKGYGH